MTVAIQEQTAQSAAYRELVSPQTFERLIARMVKDEGLEQQLAEEIMEAALGFLKMSAENPGTGFSPSPLVDIGWHTFILYTRPYAEFCEKIAGRFIHHEPNDIPGAPQAPGGIQRTIDFMSTNGLPFNELLWTGHITSSKAEVMLGMGVAEHADCDGGRGPCRLGNCTCS